ncbi:MAG TPA: TRZ/ATZ family hydrolase, partial [Methylophilaceae bacterium]|nr:TRZ/ATZ family hydrolase [Methylophilaceae bacterium]
MTESVDLLIVARWLLPVVPEDTLLENHAVAIRDGKVIGICTNDESIKHYAAKETIILTEHVLMPGLINLHMHAAMVLMRGIADDVALMPWLEQHIWPAEQKYVTP